MPDEVPDIRARRIAAQLEAWRVHAPGRLTRAAVAELCGWSPPTQTRIENAKKRVTPREVSKLADVLGVPDAEYERVLKAVVFSQLSGWWENVPEGALTSTMLGFITLEATASEVSTLRLEVVNGLCQTRDYALALARHGLSAIPDDVKVEAVEARLQRQARLTDKDALKLNVVLAESVLHNRLGDSRVMSGQRDRLLELSELPTVNIRILRPDAGPPPIGCGFSILSFPEGDSVAYLELPDEELFREDRPQVALYEAAFGALWGKRGSALDQRSSRDLIASVRY